MHTDKWGKIIGFISFVWSLLFFSHLLIGQLNQTGSLRGVVTSPDGSPIPEVTVILKSEKMILEKVETSTCSRGRYRFIGLYPGFYEISFKIQNRSKPLKKIVKVEVGKIFNMKVILQLGVVEERLIVSEGSLNIDSLSAAKSITLDSRYLKSVPAFRSLDKLMDMVPGINDQVVFGSDLKDSVYNLDGLNLLDLSGGTQGVFFGMDIVEEISVQTGGISSQYNSKGANLNIVTKSGGNKLSGSAAVYYTHEDFKSDNTLNTPLEGTDGGAKYDLEGGISIGGSILKNKIWFFGNVSFKKSKTFVNGYPMKKDLSGAAESSIPLDNYRPYLYLKLSFQPHKKDKFYISYNFSDIEQNHYEASKFHTADATRLLTNSTSSLSFNWSHLGGDFFIGNFKVSYVDSNYHINCKNDLIPKFDFNSFTYWNNGFNTDKNRRERTQINLDGTLFVEDFLGTHEIVAGGEAMFTNIERDVLFTSKLKDPVSGWGASLVIESDGITDTISYNKPVYQRQTLDFYSAFINDAWQVGERLVLNFGLRFTHQEGKIPRQGLEDSTGFIAPHLLGDDYPYYTAVEKEFTALKWTSFAPRIAVIYDITGAGTTLVKGSYSRYTGDMISSYFYDVNPNQLISYSGEADENGRVVDLSSYTHARILKTSFGKHRARAPYSDEFVVGVEKGFPHNISVSARFVKKWYKRNIEDIDATYLNLDKLMNKGELEWLNYTPVTAIDPYTGKEITFWSQKGFHDSQIYILNPPGADRTYTGFEFIFNKGFSGNWLINLSYVYSRSSGLYSTSSERGLRHNDLFNDPNLHTKGEGKDENERTHVLKVSGMFRTFFGINVGFFGHYRSGRRATRQVSSDAFDVRVNPGTTVNGDEKGSYKLPDLFTFDLKIEKSLNFGKFSLKLFVDIFNIFNEGKATEVWKDSSTAGKETFLWNGSTFSVKKNPELWEMTAISEPRIVRFGAKFEF